MVEYGLTVSLNNSPRTPNPDLELDCVDFDALIGGGAPRKQSITTEEEEQSVSISVSISPRVLFSDSSTFRHRDYPRQRLDFSSFDLAAELSPVSFTGSSSAVLSAPFEPTTMASATHAAHTTAADDCHCSSVGDCSVCYSRLPLRANHVFTLCGHLFCVKCLLKWWDNATTCPICRAEIFEQEEEDDHADVNDAAEIEVDDGGDDASGGDADGESLNDAAGNANGESDSENGNDEPNGSDAYSPPPAFEDAVQEYNDNIRNQIYLYNNSIDSDSSDDEAVEHANENADSGMNNQNQNVTLINRYMYQDNEYIWSSRQAFWVVADSHYDDTVYNLSTSEIQGLRENREIAMTLFARMRFRETMFEANTIFLGSVWSGLWIHKNEWVNITESHRRSLDSNTSIMYEFVIRRGSEFSPRIEASVFGFIKDVTIQQTVVEYDDEHVGNDHDWENTVEYAFVADVFTPTHFFINGSWDDPRWQWRSYGGYDMNDGMITTQQITISFSQIRRLYRISARERLLD
jgi:hypothetical protein